jgi:hypothetical protein
VCGPFIDELMSSGSQQLRNPRLDFRLMHITNYRFTLTSKGAYKQVIFSLKIIAQNERYMSDIFDNEKKSNK